MSKHDPQTTAEIADRLNDLRKKLAARQSPQLGNSYKDNIPALKAEIARLESL